MDKTIKPRKINKREEQKEQFEWKVLESFLQLNEQYHVISKEKGTHPDFEIILKDNSKIGIEITRLTVETEQVMAKIMELRKDVNGKKQAVDTIKEIAKKKHGAKANNYLYDDYDGHFVLSTNLYSIEVRKKIYVDKIKGKYNKYENVINQYDKFIIVCDATRSNEVTSESDAIQIIEKVNSCKYDYQYMVSIIYHNCDKNELCCYNSEIK